MIRISLVIPCYHQAQYLDECLQSVLDQTYQDWECIIVNDGSPDNTEEVAKKWLEKDNRFRYLFQENRGVSAARNFGIENAKGEWILPVDADDYISKDYLELACQFFENSDINVIYCNARQFGTVDQPFELEDFSLRNLATSNPIFCSAFYRKYDWQRVGGYDENLLSTYEDWEFWISLLKDGGNVIRLPQTCFFYRIKNDSRNSTIKPERNKELFYMEQKHHDFFFNQLGSLIRNYNYLNEQRRLNNRFLNKVVNKVYSFFD